MHGFSWRAGFVMFAVVRHRSPKSGRSVPHSYLFTVITNIELSGVVTASHHPLHGTGAAELPAAATHRGVLRPQDQRAVRVLPTGKKTFYLVYRSAAPASMLGEPHLVRVKLGRYPKVDLATAFCRQGRMRTPRPQPAAVECSVGTVNSALAGSTRAPWHADTSMCVGTNRSDGAMPPWRSAAAGELLPQSEPWFRSASSRQANGALI